MRLVTNNSQISRFNIKSCSIDLNQAFCHGQTYVALSRCMSLQGINLTHPMDLTDVMINPRIREFHQEIIRSQKLEGFMTEIFLELKPEISIKEVKHLASKDFLAELQIYFEQSMIYVLIHKFSNYEEIMWQLFKNEKSFVLMQLKNYF